MHAGRGRGPPDLPAVRAPARRQIAPPLVIDVFSGDNVEQHLIRETRRERERVSVHIYYFERLFRKETRAA